MKMYHPVYAKVLSVTNPGLLPFPEMTTSLPTTRIFCSSPNWFIGYWAFSAWKRIGCMFSSSTARLNCDWRLNAPPSLPGIGHLQCLCFVVSSQFPREIRSKGAIWWQNIFHGLFLFLVSIFHFHTIHFLGPSHNYTTYTQIIGEPKLEGMPYWQNACVPPKFMFKS